jgi:hypothetical protein
LPPPSAFQKPFIWLWAFLFGISDEKNPYKMVPMMEKANTEAIVKQNRKIEKYERQLSGTEKLKQFEAEVSAELLALNGTRVSKGDFTLDFLVELKQSSTRLGKYKNYSDGVMFYDGGGYCWQIRGTRSTRMSLVCSSENQLLEVAEVRTCEHEAVFATPAACRQEDIGRLESMGIPALEKLAQRIGLSSK